MPKLLSDYPAPLNFRVSWERKFEIIAIAYYLKYYGKYADALRWLIDKAIAAFYAELAEKPDELKQFNEILANVRQRMSLKLNLGEQFSRHDLADVEIQDE